MVVHCHRTHWNIPCREMKFKRFKVKGNEISYRKVCYLLYTLCLHIDIVMLRLKDVRTKIWLWDSLICFVVVAVFVVSFTPNVFIHLNHFSFQMGTSVISPKPIDQEPEQHFVGVIIAVLTTIILLLIAVILFIVARNKRSRRSEALNSLQFNFNQDTLGLGIDKRMNSNMKVIVRNALCVKYCHSKTSTLNCLYWFSLCQRLLHW